MKYIFRLETAHAAVWQKVFQQEYGRIQIVKNSTSKGGRGLAPLKKTAAFLMLLGVEKAQSIIAAMDNSEIRAVIAEIRNMKELSLEIQEGLWAEFRDLGYEETMNSAEVLAVLRCLFNGGIICR